jgi:hypothetical protein
MAYKRSLDAYQFTEAELAANRDGYMLPSQKQRLRESLDRRVNLWMTFAVLMVFTSICAIFQVASLHWLGVVIGVGFLAAHLWIAVLAYVSYQRMRDDMRKNDILMTEGEIRLSFKSPIFETIVLRINGLKFDVPINFLSALRNNSYYCVYYTPSTNQLLSFEQIPTKNLSEIDSNLSKKFHFDAETLVSNREGRLTDAQRRRLRVYPLRVFVKMIGFSSIVWIPILFVYFFMQEDLLWMTFTLIIILALMVMPLTLLGCYETYRDLRENQVFPVIGSVRYTSANKISGLAIGAVLFEMSRDDYLLFHDGARYQIYYTRHIPYLLSVERLKD